MSWLEVSFAHWWVLLFVSIGALAWWWASRGTGSVVFSSLRALPAGGRTWRTAISWIPDVLFGLAIASLVVALAGPRKGDKDSRIRRDGIAIMLAVDISGSMRALDLATKQNQDLTRLDAVKETFERFVLGGGQLKGRDDDAIGLVAFAAYAETRSPLTLDHGNLVAAARELTFAPQNEGGTAIGAGLELAVQRLIEFKTKSINKVAILLTDGESTVHEINEDTAIEHAVEAGIKVYTIGAGTRGVAPVRVDVGDGRTELLQTQVSIDEVTLKRIADKTGGRYFRATDHEALQQIYEKIDALERTTIEEQRFVEFHQYYGWFVVIAMILVVAALLLRGTVLRRLP
jgi:Ca-activated chloride channel family protein